MQRNHSQRHDVRRQRIAKSAMNRREFGDWQTPEALAAAVLSRLSLDGRPAPASVLEPTCGEGSFLVAAARCFQDAQLFGYEINERYALTALARLPAPRTQVAVSNFFNIEWEREIARLPDPLLVIGNPPWVTNSTLGYLGSKNLPKKHNFKRLNGLDAVTGKSNFDVSEWMILRLLAVLQSRRATLAMLCKTAVARRVVQFVASQRWPVGPGGQWYIDTMAHFQAAVDASLLVCETGNGFRGSDGWPVYASLEEETPLSTMAMIDGVLVANATRVTRTAHLAGRCDPEWRSGLKHDCSRVMELEVADEVLRNGFGERVQIEEEHLFPLLKSSDVANGVAEPRRMVIVPQRFLGQETASLRQRAPKTWEYLSAHRELLSARKSSIYRGQPDFSVFGIGGYSFAPWKVAISGLYKRCEFALLGPHHGRPIMLDDTCYFLPFTSESEARSAWEGLRSSIAQDFFAGRIFWDAKRPINKAILQRLDLQALLSGSALAC